nr:kinesin-like protein KIN-12D [Ipomoea batatas]
MVDDDDLEKFAESDEEESSLGVGVAGNRDAVGDRDEFSTTQTSKNKGILNVKLEGGNEKGREIILLTSQLNSKVQAVLEYEKKVKHVEDQLRETSTCATCVATAAFVVVNWLSELQASCIDAFKQQEVKLGEYLEANMQGHNIFVGFMHQKLEKLEVNDIMETMETLKELKTGVSVVSSCMNEHLERHGRPKRDTTN